MYLYQAYYIRTYLAFLSASLLRFYVCTHSGHASQIKLILSNRTTTQIYGLLCSFTCLPGKQKVQKSLRVDFIESCTFILY